MRTSADRPRVVIVDHADSFTHNVGVALELAGARSRIVSCMDGELDRLPDDADGIVLSAGPCTPSQAGGTVALVRALAAMAEPPPLLGVCLGHQAIACAFGGRLTRAARPLHGKTALVRHDGTGIFAALRNPLPAARYNSLAVDARSLPAALRPTAWDEHGELMALRHARLPLDGVQFHPESWLSPGWSPLFETWVARCTAYRRACEGPAARAG